MHAWARGAGAAADAFGGAAVITPDTPLEELETFLDSDGVSFALVTDGSRKFVLGLVTREDLKKCVFPYPGLPTLAHQLPRFNLRRNPNAP